MKLLRAIPALPVISVTSSAAFYQGKLGFAITHQWEGFAILQLDEVVLHLWQSDDEGWKSRSQPAVSPVRSGAESFIAGTASCRIQLEGVEELHGQLAPLGILHPNSPLHETEWGTREFAVLDPDGNLITFFERPKQ